MQGKRVKCSRALMPSAVGMMSQTSGCLLTCPYIGSAEISELPVMMHGAYTDSVRLW